MKFHGGNWYGSLKLIQDMGLLAGWLWGIGWQLEKGCCNGATKETVFVFDCFL